MSTNESTQHPSTATATTLVTLGHDGLTTTADAARSAVAGILATHGASTLAQFRNGEGIWEDENGDTVHESTDAWLVLLPVRNIPHVRTCLAHLARKFDQDALGFLIHDGETYGPSYVEAEQ